MAAARRRAQLAQVMALFSIHKRITTTTEEEAEVFLSVTPLLHQNDLHASLSLSN